MNYRDQAYRCYSFPDQLLYKRFYFLAIGYPFLFYFILYLHYWRLSSRHVHFIWVVSSWSWNNIFLFTRFRWISYCCDRRSFSEIVAGKIFVWAWIFTLISQILFFCFPKLYWNNLFFQYIFINIFILVWRWNFVSFFKLFYFFKKFLSFGKGKFILTLI